MPTILFYGPKLNYEQKKELIGSFTETITNITGIHKSRVVIYLRPNSPAAMGIGGELFSDNLKRTGKKYYTET